MGGVLKILNQNECSGSGSCGGQCSSPSVSSSQQSCSGSADARRDFLKNASTLVCGSFTLTLFPFWSEAEKDSGDETANAIVPAENSTVDSGSPAPNSGRTVLYGFLVDNDRCTGAGKCLTACRTENKVPEGVSRTWVERYVHYIDGRVQVDLVPESGYHGSGLPEIDRAQVSKAYFVPKLCNQCADAPCNQMCPVHASFKTPEGVQLIDSDRCIGCGYCVQSCPYGMRFINPETNNADKCTWCYHRITHNELPACVEACPTGARVFGRLDDPNSELSKRLATVRTQVLKEHLGTHPNVHYTALSGDVI